MPDLQLPESRDVLKAEFESLRGIDDLAALLHLRPDQLTHYTFGRGRRYRSFDVAKRRGGVRTINEPHAGLKVVQKKFAQVLTSVYRPRSCVHGFVEDRSIATNAQQHVGSDWVLNVDLKDFFPSINFGRVRGLFIKRYGFTPQVATVAARICVFGNELPQGAPTSPVLSNMIAGALDKGLTRLARRYRCTYTRFADDLTFSCNGDFPEALGYWDPAARPNRESRVGDRLKALVEDNGFEVNQAKVRLAFRDERQEVTGLIVNAKVNVRRDFVRRIRAMLHAWDVYGEAAAEAEHFSAYDDKDRSPHAILSFRRLVKGHIDFLGMIRGTDHAWYRDFINQYADLVPGYVVRPPTHRRPNHLRTWRDAIWVIETDETQGTAFEAAGKGLVTCAHVIRDIDSPGHPPYSNPYVYSSRNEAVRYPVREIAYDADRDLAVLAVETTSGCELLLKPAPLASIGDPVITAGFPGHAPGATLWEETGSVTHLRRHMGHPRYMVTNRIVAGASGSPIMDLEHRVLAVATTGENSFAATALSGVQAGSGYGGIPIQELDRVLPAASRTLPGSKSTRP